MLKNLARKALLSLALLLFTVAVFHTAVGYGIINCDDYDYLLNHPEVTGGLSVSGIRWAFTNMQEAAWFPLTWLSYMTDYSLGLGFGGMHWISILLHGLNAALLFILLSRLFPKHSTIFILAATLIWAIHPLRVESVVWLASRKDVLSTFFFLLSLLFWTSRSSASTLLAFLSLLCGAAAKPSVMVFPVFAILIDLLILDRRKPWPAYVFAILLAIGIAAEASLAQNVGGAMSATSHIPLWYRLLNAIAALTIYLGNFILPLNLAPQCLLRYPDLPRFSPVGSIALGSIVTWIVLVWRNKLSPHFSILPTLKTPREAIGWCNAFVADIPTPLCGLLIFFLSLVPFLGLIGFGIHAFADRFTLLPAIGLSILLLSILPPSRHAPRSTLYTSLLVCVVLFFSFRTHHQVSFWENDGRLFDHTAAVDGDSNAHALVNAAKYYYEFEHDLAKAHDRLVRALKGRNGLDEVGHVGNIYMEAAFVAKDDEDMDNCLTWLSKWDDRESERMQIETGIFSNCHSIPYATAEILRLATKPGLYETATNKFEALKRNLPRHHSVRVLAYRLAEIKGDPDEIAARKAECADCDDDPYIRNRWAR